MSATHIIIIIIIIAQCKHQGADVSVKVVNCAIDRFESNNLVLSIARILGLADSV